MSQSRALKWRRSPFFVAFPQLPRMVHPALVYSGIMLRVTIYLNGIPEPSLIPEYYSKKYLGVNGFVMM